MLVLITPLVICWEIWVGICSYKYGETEKLAYSSMKHQASGIFRKATNLAFPHCDLDVNWSKICELIEKLKPMPRSTTVLWQLPDQGNVKVNSDGSFPLSSGKAGISGIIRDFTGKMIIGFAIPTKFSGKLVGIIGLGRIGSAIAKRAEAFGCPISYHSRSKKPNLNYKYYSTVVDLAANSEILIVACALTEETRDIVNRKVLDALGPKGILINIGRGAHVDESELVAALIEGRINGAGLDVYKTEPEVPEQLFGLENVVLLSHAASDTVETCMAMADLVIENLEAHFLHKPLLTPVV
ncbi:hypothetical protein CQW23_28572 [Capsicum baccatum]|uniref:D-isomer specific 2-hydroxyacid dehydrogenase NAD-binding domain-containing protein n=1 Tax=Capsicum baccatum TaxID=33114 RepID=A0A2G2VGW9_CAPBA|nr:hypothetical protein CQW23_28572 [Capsicum baccatum]